MTAIYISIGPYTTLEKEILQEEVLRVLLLTHSLNTIVKVFNFPCTAILKGSLPRVTEKEIPEILVGYGERKKAELQSLHSSAQFDRTIKLDWIIIARPAQGYLNEQRLQHFWQELQKLPKATQHVVSTVPLSANYNPLWQTTFFDRQLLTPYGFCKPVCGEWPFQNIYKLDPQCSQSLARKEFYDVGSQGLKVLHKNDQALYAVRASALRNISNRDLEEPLPIATPLEDLFPEEQLLYNTFLLDRQQPIEIKNLLSLFSTIHGGQYGNPRHGR